MTLTQEFPKRATSDICAEAKREGWSRERRTIELALQWQYREQAGEIVYSDGGPRPGVDIRRDIRATRIRLRGVRRRAKVAE